jgi:hypothetical protein
MEKEFFDLLGLGVPFYLAAATYGVFAWLDSNASDEATKVISSWLHGRSHNEPDLGNLIINAFDRVYTSPLFTYRAFERSAAISTIIWIPVTLLPVALFNMIILFNHPDLQANSTPGLFSSPRDLITALIVLLYVTVLSDYVSLPFVRRFLSLARTSPIRASVMSSIVGLVVVTICFLICLFVEAAVVYRTNLGAFIPDTLNMLFEPTFWVTVIKVMRSAFVIHLLLPLFALSSVVVRLVFWIFRVVEWAQWFLKQGDAHPLKAIGMVATIIVFGSAMLVKEGWALLSVLERI